MCSFKPTEHHLYYSVSTVAGSFQIKGQYFLTVLYRPYGEEWWRQLHVMVVLLSGRDAGQNDQLNAERSLKRTCSTVHTAVCTSVYSYIIHTQICTDTWASFTKIPRPLSVKNNLRLMKKEPRRIIGFVREHLRGDKV